MTTLFNLPGIPTTTKTTKPDWRTIQARNQGTHEKLIGTKAITRPCHECGTTTLIGWDDHRIAALAQTDPTPLTSTLEAACVLMNRPTYRLWGKPGNYQLTPRHQPRIHNPIQMQPAGETTLVVPAHICHQPLSNDWIQLYPTKTTTVTDGPPPF